MEALRKCLHCNLEANSEEDLAMFVSNPRGKYGRENICNECSNTRSAEYKKNNSEKVRESSRKWARENRDKNRSTHYKHRYGIVLDDYNRMFEEQDGYCGICGTHQARFKKRLAVDHCHETGDVRGLLCDDCNKGLGNFKDNVDYLSKALQYLRAVDSEVHKAKQEITKEKEAIKGMM